MMKKQSFRNMISVVLISYLFGTNEEQRKKRIELNNNKIRKPTCIRLLVKELTKKYPRNKNIYRASLRKRQGKKGVDDLDTHLTNARKQIRFRYLLEAQKTINDIKKKRE